MRLSELQNKDIVNVVDGKKIGNIVDVNIDSNSGDIISLVIETNKSIFSFGKGDKDTEINWSSITKIGSDVILVNSNLK